MRIGELAAELGVNPRTLRFYEQRGILAPARRTPNGYREFDARDLDRLSVAGELRSVFTERRRQIAKRSSELTSLYAVLVALDQALIYPPRAPRCPRRASRLADASTYQRSSGRRPTTHQATGKSTAARMSLSASPKRNGVRPISMVSAGEAETTTPNHGRPIA